MPDELLIVKSEYQIKSAIFSCINIKISVGGKRRLEKKANPNIMIDWFLRAIERWKFYGVENFSIGFSFSFRANVALNDEDEIDSNYPRLSSTSLRWFTLLRVIIIIIDVDAGIWILSDPCQTTHCNILSKEKTRRVRGNISTFGWSHSMPHFESQSTCQWTPLTKCK